ncbi:MAG: PD-(D/E)XK nuclease family transposase, partial [Lachnospiraceae bacterium]|nr:PD-(D/E)XK nuclease family transposase [Lachnospiraceae bacterium]
MNEKETLPVAERDRERLEREHQKDLERIRGFRLIDDDFMNVCFDDNIPVTELLLRIILGRQVFVKQVRTQRNFKNLVGRDLYLDVLAVEDDGTQMNVEIQRSDSGADPKRARYHSSILDSHSLKPSEDFTMLPETYVIFITEN